MSWLFFLDESGHDHQQMPYEVRGGVAIHASRLWSFIQRVQQLELDSFGCSLHLYQKEIKGSTLLDRKRYRFATQMDPLAEEDRQRYCRSFLTKGLEKQTPTQVEFTAYGQACLTMADGMFQAMHAEQAVLFASVIPKGTRKPRPTDGGGYLRKDHVYLFERFFYQLEQKQEHGILVMDEVEKTEDRRFVARMERYFTRTSNGRYRTRWIVPVPFFVSSEMSYAVQAADLCIYCINWGFRRPAIGMDAEVREEIALGFGVWLDRLQFRGQGYRDGKVFDSFGIAYVPNPYTSDSGA